MDRAKKYVVSGALDQVDWNSELVHGDLGKAVQQLKQEPGRPVRGGMTLPLALANLGLIDEYEFVVHPVVAGHGPTLLAGLRERLDLKLVERQEFKWGAVALRTSPVESRPEGRLPLAPIAPPWKRGHSSWGCRFRLRPEPHGSSSTSANR